MDDDIHVPEESEQRWRRLYKQLNRIERMVNFMAGELDALTAEVAAEETVEDSAIALINGLAAQLASAGTDPAKLSALTASIKAKSDALAAAVTANTVAAPVAATPPTPAVTAAVTAAASAT